MIMATAKAIRPSSSAAAKPKIRRGNWPSAAAGLRSAPCRNEPKTMPTPAAAAPTPMAARPAPMTWADASSILLLLERGPRGLVKVDRVVDVHRCQQREHVSLDGADQQLERVDEGDEQEAEHRHDIAAAAGVDALDDEIPEHLQQDVAGEHGDERPQPEAEGADQEADEFDRRDQQFERDRHSLGPEQRQEVEAVLPEADPEHDQEADDRHRSGDRELAGDRKGMHAGD